MDSLFFELLSMSLKAGVLALAVCLVRLIFKKMPKKICVVLWGLVGLRLIMPFSIQSPVSLIPETEPMRKLPELFAVSSVEEIPVSKEREWTTVGFEAENDFVPVVPAQTDGAEKSEKTVSLLPVLWLCGTGVMLIYAAVSYIRLKKRTATSIQIENGIFLCDEIKTPFILGVWEPHILLPSSLTPEQRELVLLHEKAHISRLDNIWKPLGFVLLSVYWFNPLLWLAFILLCRDIELACDEKVIENMKNTEKADYSQALLDCSSPKRSVSACPLAFGETGVKTRVKKILNYKKPAFWVIIAAVAAGVALSVFFLTDPVEKPDETTVRSGYRALPVEDVSGTSAEPEPKADFEEAIHEVLVKLWVNSYRGECVTEGHITLGTEEKDGVIRAYLLTDISSYGFENGFFTEFGGHLVPTVLIFHEKDGLYCFDKLLEPEDGDKYEESIKEIFPLKYHSRVLGEWSESDRVSMIEQNEAQARAYLDSIGRTEEIRIWRDIEHTLFSDVGITPEVEDKIDEAMRYIEHYQLYFGYEEQLRDGVRYILRTEYDRENNAVIYTKEIYESGETVYRYAFDGATGEMLHPANVSFSEDIKLAAENPRDAQELLNYVITAVADNENADGKEPTAVITKAQEQMLGLAGIFDGMNVYDTEYTVNGTSEKTYEIYVFIYYTADNDMSILAGAMTYDEIKEKYGNQDNASSDAELLRTAASALMNNLAPAKEKLKKLYPE